MAVLIASCYLSPLPLKRLEADKNCALFFRVFIGTLQTLAADLLVPDRRILTCVDHT